jgi:hypothetical protein
MENSNSNSLTDSILQPSISSSSPIQSSVSSSGSSLGSDGGFFDNLKNINLTTWLLIVLILAFLGFNIFVYLAKGTQDITNFFAPIIKKLFGTTIAVTGQAIDVSAEGAKAVVSGTASAVNAGLTAVQDITPNSAQSSMKSQPLIGTTGTTGTTGTRGTTGTQGTQGTQGNVDANNALHNALNNAHPSEENPDYSPHEASSSKAGWCFIGEDRGYRSCAEVGVNDKCMSGDIFPSQELCINPNLRA